MIDDLKTSSGTAFRLGALALACGVGILITTGFLCAALFVVTLRSYGLTEACLSGAAVYFVVTLITVASYFLYKREVRRRALEVEKSALASALADPAMIAIAIQVARTVGFKRLVPLLAIAAIALGISAGRHHQGTDSNG